MTTIACDGKSMAGDGFACARGSIVDHATVKVYRATDGCILGCAGEYHDALAFLAWRNGGDRPKIKAAFEALVLMASGDLSYHCEKDLEGVPQEIPAAIGSGMDFALGAMDGGATPESAIEIASNRDPYTGGTATIIHLARLEAVNAA